MHLIQNHTLTAREEAVFDSFTEQEPICDVFDPGVVWRRIAETESIASVSSWTSWASSTSALSVVSDICL